MEREKKKELSMTEIYTVFIVLEKEKEKAGRMPLKG
jgi:hypothetical protein